MSFYKKITKNINVVLSISVLIIICVFVYKNTKEFAEGDSEEKPEEKPEDKQEEKPECEYPDDLWLEKHEGQCVVSFDDESIVPCRNLEDIDGDGNSKKDRDAMGVRLYINKSLTPETCPQKTKQEECKHFTMCPQDCTGAWSKWGECIEKPCGEQPSESRFYTQHTQVRFGGKPCQFKTKQEQKRKCGEIVKCDDA
tara:strand:- start:9 stop:599 length:591 start_codon:yes stop_codon:yes gene_type:complete